MKSNKNGGSRSVNLFGAIGVASSCWGPPSEGPLAATKEILAFENLPLKGCAVI